MNQSTSRWLSIRRALPVAGALACALCWAGIAFADAAPPEMPPGSTIGTDAPTQVQMRSERVVLQVMTRTVPAEGFGIVSDAAWARVTAEFHMRNTGSADEHMQVRFPLADPYGEGAFFSGYPEVNDFNVWVDGAARSSTVITSANPLGADWPAITWAAWDMSFPQAGETVISVTYVISPTGYFPEARFSYVMSTGAGWKGRIGTADIVARLPYAATPENVVLDRAKTTRGARLAGNEVRWSLRNLEPARASDIKLTVLAPNIWEAIVQARAAARQSPRDAALWMALGQAYYRAIPMKYGPIGGAQYVKLSQQAMQTAVALAPKSAEAHAAYAELLLNLYRFDVQDHPQGSLARRIIREAQAALKLDPENTIARQVLGELGQPQG